MHDRKASKKMSFKDILQLIEKHLYEDSKSRLLDYKSPQQLQKLLALELPDHPSNFEEIRSFVTKYLKYSMRTSHPQYFNQLWAGFSDSSLIAEMLSTATNTSMYTYEVAPVASLLEHHIFAELNSWIGFDQGEGLFVTGGSNANLVACLLARQKYLPRVKEEGFFSCAKAIVFTSDQAHYSLLKAANVIGIGMNQVVKVKTNSKGQMIPEELQKAIETEKQNGHRGFLVSATSGTTVLGAYDPLDEIAEICQNQELWFHVDGAYGASVLFSEREKHRMKGIEKADSLAWDFHKMLGLPLMCSIILVKEKGNLYQTNSTSKNSENYIFHEKEGSEFDLGPISLQCGRKVDVLKIWLAWLEYGKSGIEQRMNHLFDLAQYAEQKVLECNELELVAPVEGLNICFRYKVDKNSDAFQIRLREELLKRELSAVNHAVVDGKRIIRLVTLNADSSTKDLDQFFDNLLLVARELNQENPIDLGL